MPIPRRIGIKELRDRVRKNPCIPVAAILAISNKKHDK
jgi:hypothetical protein